MEGRGQESADFINALSVMISNDVISHHTVNVHTFAVLLPFLLFYSIQFLYGLRFGPPVRPSALLFK